MTEKEPDTHVWEGYGYYTLTLGVDGGFRLDCEGVPVINGIPYDKGDQTISVHGVDRGLRVKYGDPEPMPLVDLVAIMMRESEEPT